MSIRLPGAKNARSEPYWDNEDRVKVAKLLLLGYGCNNCMLALTRCWIPQTSVCPNHSDSLSWSISSISSMLEDTGFNFTIKEGINVLEMRNEQDAINATDVVNNNGYARRLKVSASRSSNMVTLNVKD